MDENTPEIYDPEAYKEQILMRGAGQELVGESDPEAMAAYIREFTIDKPFIIRNGQVVSGTVPAENIRNYWGIDNPNFVLSSFDKDDKKIIEDLLLVLETALSSYNVNYRHFNKERVRILDTPLYDTKEKEMRLLEVDNRQYLAEQRVYRIIDRFNQEIHTFAKTNRAGRWRPGAERMSIISKAIMSDRPTSGDKTGMEKWFGRNKK
jgi:hypothetical protein